MHGTEQFEMLPEQEAQAGCVHLWQLRRQANSFSNGFAIREFQCPMLHMYKCNVGLRILEGLDFMQLERCGLHNKLSHVVTATCRTFLGRFPDDDLLEHQKYSSDEDEEDEDEEDEDEDEEEADDEDYDSGDDNDANALPSDGDGMYPNFCALS
jgi:hypothetical protein